MTHPTEAAKAAKEVHDSCPGYLTSEMERHWMPELTAIIDSHFAPLREENDKLRAAVEGTYSLALAWANYYAMQYDCKGGAHPRHRAILDEAKAALAPERKETT